MTDIIPFGKYRGQEIEQVRQRDPAYLQWLVQQAWFSEKFAPIYQLVVNNFVPPSEETPAHNALQVRFLDFNFQAAFWYASGADEDVGWEILKQRFNDRVKISNLRKAPKPKQLMGPILSEHPPRRVGAPEKYWLEAHRNEVRARWKTWRIRNKQPTLLRSFWSASFEDVSDVKFGLTVSVGWGKAHREFDVTHDLQIYIEIKPSMGDDYPAVLRQMKRQQQQLESRWNTIWCLLIDQFASQAVTLEQVRKIFKRDKIRIVVMQDIRDHLINREATD